MSLITDPTLQDPDIGSPDDHSHYARKSAIAEAAVEGGLVTALCGVKFSPVRDPNNYPTCQLCSKLLEQFGERNNS